MARSASPATKNQWCRGQDFAFRVDTQAVQDWMRSVLSPQEWAGLQFAG